jgi:hypothetical protein
MNGMHAAHLGGQDPSLGGGDAPDNNSGTTAAAPAPGVHELRHALLVLATWCGEDTVQERQVKAEVVAAFAAARGGTESPREIFDGYAALYATTRRIDDPFAACGGGRGGGGANPSAADDSAASTATGRVRAAPHTDEERTLASLEKYGVAMGEYSPWHVERMIFATVDAFWADKDEQERLEAVAMLSASFDSMHQDLASPSPPPPQHDRQQHDKQHDKQGVSATGSLPSPLGLAASLVPAAKLRLLAHSVTQPYITAEVCMILLAEVFSIITSREEPRDSPRFTAAAEALVAVAGAVPCTPFPRELFESLMAIAEPVLASIPARIEKHGGQAGLVVIF